MSRFYVLTIQQHKGVISIKNYNKALNKLEKIHGIEIFPRHFEIGGKMKRLHVHCLVTQSLGDDPITYDSFSKTVQKNHRRNLDFEECRNKQAWLAYSSKEQFKKKLSI